MNRVGGLLLAMAIGLAPASAGAQDTVSPPPQEAIAPASQPITPATDAIAKLVQQQAPPVVLDVRMGEHADRTRFVVELSDPVETRIFTLTNPDRVVIDMPELLWRVPSGERPSGKGVVNSYRYGLFRKGNSRFVIDLNQPAKAEDVKIYPPEGGYGFRLVIDLHRVTPAAFAESAGWPKADRSTPPGAVASLPQPALAPQPVPGTPESGVPDAKRVIVVDAGHGGVDPGTHGKSGTLEKDIVLGVAAKLAAALEARGQYRVKLTRDADFFIPLRERVNIARAARGDLFVSLHVDSISDPSVRGASIYTLSDQASDREAAKLADKENMSDVIAGVDLAGDNAPVALILIDLAQRDTMNRSARLAETVLEQLPKATMVRPSTPHRSAGFAVLKGPDIPAVLVELGYLSNAKDEALMRTDEWRQRVAGAIADAVDRHFEPRQAPSRQASVP